jgi:hypothetical protein
LGWVLALVWAFTKDSAMEELARQHMNRPPVPPNPRPLREYNSRQVEDGRYLE